MKKDITAKSEYGLLEIFPIFIETTFARHKIARKRKYDLNRFERKSIDLNLEELILANEINMDELKSSNVLEKLVTEFEFLEGRPGMESIDVLLRGTLRSLKNIEIFKEFLSIILQVPIIVLTDLEELEYKRKAIKHTENEKARMKHGYFYGKIFPKIN